MWKQKRTASGNRQVNVNFLKKGVCFMVCRHFKPGFLKMFMSVGYSRIATVDQVTNVGGVT
jgi:hypothetical protein